MLDQKSASVIAGCKRAAEEDGCLPPGFSEVMCHSSEGKQTSLTGCNGSSEHAHVEDKVLHEQGRTGNPRVKGSPEETLCQGQEDHEGKGSGEKQILQSAKGRGLISR